MSGLPENIQREILIANIFVGTAFETAPIGFRTDDNTDVDPADIEARFEAHRGGPDGPLICSMATAGGGDADGTITVIALDDSNIGLVLALDEDFTSTLDPSYDDMTNAVQLAGVGQLELWSEDMMGGEHQPGAWFHVRIWPEVV